MDAQAWPRAPEELEALQRRLGGERPAPWIATGAERVGGAFVAFSTRRGRGAEAAERAWAVAVVLGKGGAVADRSVVASEVEAGYRAGFLALREGALLERAIRALERPPEVLLVNASGRDHPRRAGLALHLGAILGVPTVGVTDRPLVATGGEPEAQVGSSEALLLDGEVVGFRVRTRSGSRPVCVHAAWRTEPETARAVVLAAATGARTPEPIRLARFLARSVRARDEGRSPPGREAAERADLLSR